MAFKLDSKIPAGELAQKWSNHKAAIKVVSPANKRKLDIIVIGTGLGGASAAASLGELGYNVKVFCIQDSPRRAHSIAAQGGINAAKNYQNDNDSVYRLFYDTIKGGDARPTSIVWPRFRTSSSTSAWPRECPSHASTAACWPTVRSAARRYRVPSMPAARRVSSSFWVPTPH
jgi:choline dehydrogenase-like flavoprotein